jgi:hypothetical protein
MYEEFTITDPFTHEELHCTWKATVVAIATRHVDATDIRFDVNGRPMWLALPNEAWVEQKRRTGKVITDALAAQIAGRHLRQLICEGCNAHRELYTLTIEETLAHLTAIVSEAKGLHTLPSLPVIA